MSTLNPNSQRFCELYVEHGNAALAYQEAYEHEEIKPWMRGSASKKLKESAIASYINELNEKHQNNHSITVDSLLKELEEAREIAKEKADSSAMVRATMGKARMLGYDKQVVKHEGAAEAFADLMKEISDDAQQ